VHFSNTVDFHQYGRFFHPSIFENSFKINNMTKFNAEREADIARAIEYLERTPGVKIEGCDQIPRTLSSSPSASRRPKPTKRERRLQQSLGF
jgi:hypothetical protein